MAALGTSGRAEICEEGAAPIYPVEQILFSDGLEMDSLLFPYVFDRPLPAFDSGAWQSLSGLPQSAVDVLLLSYLDASMQGGAALDRWVTLWPEDLWTAVMDGLDRHGLTGQKAELERLPEIVPMWRDGPEARTTRIIELWRSESEERQHLEVQIADVMARYIAVSPAVPEVLASFVEATPELAVYYALRRQDLGDEAKLHWLADVLGWCLNDRPGEAGQPMPIEALLPPRGDLLLLAMLHRELMYQIADMYYEPADPSLKLLLSQMAQSAEKAGLRDEAELLRKVDAARDRMQAQTLLALLDPARILNAAKRMALSAQLWPQ